MKKSFFRLLLALPFILSCSSDKDDDKDGGLEAKIFTIENGTYKSGDLPSGDDSFISNLQMNKNVINGGASLITLSSSEQLSDLYVGVKDTKGYFECPLNSVKTPSAQGDSYEYEVIILLAQELSEAKFTVSLSAVSSSGKRNRIINSSEIDVVEVATGKLQVSLSWDQTDDVDLYLQEPDGNFIYYGNYMSCDDPNYLFNFACFLINKYTNHSTAGLDFSNEDDLELLEEYSYDIPETIDFINELKKYAEQNNSSNLGFLDLDSNAGCDIDGINNENITYLKIKDGVYTVAVDLYKKCNSTTGAKYAVTVNYDGKPFTISTKQSGQFSNTNDGNYGDLDNLVVIGQFRISGGKCETVGSRSMEVRSLSISKNDKLQKIVNKISKTTSK